MLTEKKITDKIEIINEGNFIQVRERHAILKDGVEIASTFFRYTISKESDRMTLDNQVKKIADALWGQQENLNISESSGSI